MIWQGSRRLSESLTSLVHPPANAASMLYYWGLRVTALGKGELRLHRKHRCPNFGCSRSSGGPEAELAARAVSSAHRCFDFPLPISRPRPSSTSTMTRGARMEKSEQGGGSGAVRHFLLLLLSTSSGQLTIIAPHTKTLLRATNPARPIDASVLNG
jgi:hypothetical protein